VIAKELLMRSLSSENRWEMLKGPGRPFVEKTVHKVLPLSLFKLQCHESYLRIKGVTHLWEAARIRTNDCPRIGILYIIPATALKMKPSLESQQVRSHNKGV
jgi:hypothetical protein